MAPAIVTLAPAKEAPEPIRLSPLQLLNAVRQRLLELSRLVRKAEKDERGDAHARLYLALVETISPLRTLRLVRVKAGVRSWWPARREDRHIVCEFDPAEIDARFAHLSSSLETCVKQVESAALHRAAEERTSSTEPAAAAPAAYPSERLLRLAQRIIGESSCRVMRLRWLSERVSLETARCLLRDEAALLTLQIEHMRHVFLELGAEFEMRTASSDAQLFVEERVSAVEGTFVVPDGATLLPAVISGERLVIKGRFARHVSRRTS